AGRKPAEGVGLVLDGAFLIHRKHVRLRRGRGGRIEIDGGDLAVRLRDDDMAAVPADAGGSDRDDSGHQRAGHDCIDRVAAGGEDGGARSGGLRLAVDERLGRIRGNRGSDKTPGRKGGGLAEKLTAVGVGHCFFTSNRTVNLPFRPVRSTRPSASRVSFWFSTATSVI